MHTNRRVTDRGYFSLTVLRICASRASKCVRLFWAACQKSIVL